MDASSFVPVTVFLAAVMPRLDPTRAINSISPEPIVRDINLSCGLTVSRV